MKKYKIITKIEIVELDDSSDTRGLNSIGEDGSTFTMELSENDGENIDITESSTMNLLHRSARSALSEHFTQISKKNSIPFSIHPRRNRGRKTSLLYRW